MSETTPETPNRGQPEDHTPEQPEPQPDRSGHQPPEQPERQPERQPGAPTDAAGSEGDAMPSENTTTTVEYERTETGHRVTRRTIERHEVTQRTENDTRTEETITEALPATAFQAPLTSDHPRPVG